MKKRLQIISYFAFAILTNEVQNQTFESGLTYTLTYKSAFAEREGRDDIPGIPDEDKPLLSLGSISL